MIYLIDFENVHEEGFSALGRLGEKDAVYCFFTRNVAKISMSALAGMRSGQLHFIEAESGKQSLDLVLVSYLGYLIGTKPQELYYDIVSNDNGFTKAAEFWNKRGNGLRVRVRKTADLKAKSEPVKTLPVLNNNQPQRAPVLKSTDQSEPATEAAALTAAAPAEGNVQSPAEPKPENTKQNQPKQRGRQRIQRQRGVKQERQMTVTPTAVPAAASAAASSSASSTDETGLSKPADSEIKPAEVARPVAETKPADPTAPAVTEEPGIGADAMDFIQAQAEKYRNDKNMKQLVYRAVVKKYGQKNGTQLYNSVKKQLLK